MTFALTSLLYFLPLALLPILFHFLFRRRSRKLQFTTLMFFYRTDPKIATRNRLREWLILLCRALVLALLILALARPSFFVGAEASGSSDSVIIIDNSASMARPAQLDPRRSCLDIACDSALNFMRQSKASTIAVITASDAAIMDTAATGSVQDGIKSLRVTAASSDMPGSLTKASSLFGPAGGIIHIFSDCQEHDFTAFPTVNTENVSVRIHRIQRQMPQLANVVVRSVNLPRQILLPGHPCQLDIILENNSQFDANITVSVTDSAAKVQNQTVDIKANSIKPLPITLPGMKPGFHPVSVSITGDGFSADNTASAAILCREPVSVVFGGSRADFGLIPLALAPLDNPDLTGVSTVFRAIGRIQQYVQENQAAMLILTAPGSAELEKLMPGWQKTFVESGGNMLIVPAVSSQATLPQLPEFIPVKFSPFAQVAQPALLEQTNTTGRFWYRLYGSEPPRTEKIIIRGFYPLILTGETQELLSCDLTQPVLAHISVGGGNVFVSGFAFDNKSSALPQSPLMVVLLQNMVTIPSEAASGSPAYITDQRIVSLYAGQKVDLPLISGPVNAVSLSGTMLRYAGSLADLPPVTASGVVMLESDSGTMALAYSSHIQEGVDKYLSDTQLASFAQGTDLACDTISTTTDYGSYAAAPRRLLEMYQPLILAALLFFISESVLANKPIKSYLQPRQGASQ